MQQSEGYVTMGDGVRLFFQTVGSGPQTVVLLNGMYLFDEFKDLTEGRTLIFVDLRNRGRSDYITDDTKLALGILQDVEDVEAVRRHFGVNPVDLIGYSYTGILPILYAMKYPDCVNRIVQLGSIPPNHRKEYPLHLTNEDETLAEFFRKAGELEKERQSAEPVEFCGKLWALLRVLYVANPADAEKIRHWQRCDLATELNLMKYWVGQIAPSIQSLDLTAEDIAQVKATVLTVHGVLDRSAPYGGGRDWAFMLPNARLLTVEEAAHAPWIEAPEVLNSIRTFLNGAWPEEAEQVEEV